MQRYLMKIAYDGTDFCGWQIQKDVRTVQETIENALGKICKQPCPIVGAGRTDSGVHAWGQYAHFDFSLSMQPEQIRKAINSLLPADVQIGQVQAVAADFHARYDALERRYRYVLARQRNPFNQRFCSHIPRAVFAQAKLEACSKYFLGEHDFSSFSKHNPDLQHQRCIISQLKFSLDDEKAVFEISANRFLHNMVRRIVGTLVNISITDSSPEIIQELILRQNPSHKLITTAPANGLFLADVIYAGINDH
ncbi:MAG: tRNA pseudouridine(38-40) synthase TruA [Candidatus Cloacimonadales bacterium]